MKYFISQLLLFLLFVCAGFATTILVPGDYATIQQAIDSCASGDTILVAPQTYNESLVTNENSIVLASYFLTTGDSSHIEATVINGADGPVISVNNGADSVTVIGFTLAGGASDRGAGINISNARLIARNNLFQFNDTGNWRTGYGGGIYGLLSGLILTDNRFEYNASDYGGAVYASECRVRITGNTFKYNRVQVSGGALSLGSSEVYIADNLFFQNWGFQRGGAITCGGTRGIIEKNDFIENINAESDSVGSEYGGALSCTGIVHGTLKILNNRIVLNKAAYGGALVCGSNVLVQNNLILNNSDGLGGAIYIDGDARIVNNTIYGNSGYSTIYIKSGSPEITNNIIWDNHLRSEWKTIYIVPAPGTPVISYCDIQDGFAGPGNIIIDPQFRDAAGGDFHLQSTACGDALNSSCIDAGSPDYEDLLLSCTAGLGTIASDMGAYGGGRDLSTYLKTETVVIPEKPYLISLSPNPFNSTVKITFEVEQTQVVSVSVYSIGGQEIRKLYTGFAGPGKNTLLWDGFDETGAAVASGSYIISLTAGNRTFSEKAVLIK